MSLKSTLIISGCIVIALNIGHGVRTFQKHQTAFFENWAATTDVNNAGYHPTKNSAVASEARSAEVVPSPLPASTDLKSDIKLKLANAGFDTEYADLYYSVQQQTGTPWQLLAAVHKVETGQSGSTSVTSYAGAKGPMQFMPATFNHYAADGNGDGTTNIHDIDDAMLTAGKYLAAGGADKGKYDTALYNYNHSWSYVGKVENLAHTLGL